MNDYVFSGRVVCMGAINMDLCMSVPRLPLPGETLITDNFANFPGGKGGNQAVTAARMRADTHFFGKLGKDIYSDQLLREMSAVGVNIDNVFRDGEHGAGIAMITVAAGGQNTICFTPGANKFITDGEIRAGAPLFNPGDILLITQEIGVDKVYAAIETAKARGAFVLLDPAPAFPDIPAHIPALVDIVKPNETEAEIITGAPVTGVDSAIAALERMEAMGFRLPIVTLGENGSVLRLNGKATHMEPPRVRAVDATAAGDVYQGALAAALAANRGLEYAARFACVASALSTTVNGAQTSVPAYEKVMEAL